MKFERHYIIFGNLKYEFIFLFEDKSMANKQKDMIFYINDRRVRF